MEESASSRNDRQGPTTRTADRSLAVLRLIADAPGTTLAEVARAVGLPASTALRHLRNLEGAGFVERDDTGRYRAGPELLRIARALTLGRSLPALAQPHLDALASATGETAYLAVVADATAATYVATAPGRHAIRHATWLGAKVPRRGTAVGAALAGKLDADGVAVRVAAVEDGVTAVSAPVLDRSGATIGALCVVGPSFRLDGAALVATRAAVAAAVSVLGDGAEGRVPSRS